ncbi:MAG: hypothetical protein AAGF12_16020 [Myxococcota bacterium]
MFETVLGTVLVLLGMSGPVALGVCRWLGRWVSGLSKDLRSTRPPISPGVKISALLTPLLAVAMVGGFFHPAFLFIGGTLALGVLCYLVPSFLVSLGRVYRRYRQIRQIEQLRNGRTAADGLHRLYALLARPTANNHVYAKRLWTVVDQLTRSFHYEEVIQVIENAELHRLRPSGKALLSVYGALAALHLGDPAGARAWLEVNRGPLAPEWERWRTTLDALLSASEGNPRRARELLAAIDEEEYALERSVASAHVLAAQGKEVEAQEELLRVRVQLQDEELDSLEVARGPATRLAKSMKHGGGSPFR